MSSFQLRPFHLAIPVNSLQLARNFYGDILGLSEGRSASEWIDYNFFGHQLVCHLSDKGPNTMKEVDGKKVPIPHFGIVLSYTQFQEFSKSLLGKKIEFIIEPCVRFRGKPGEQQTMFFKDPFGNAIEFKAFKHDEDLFKNT
ncbi:MAG: glyoxalase [Gammaproteobacteria bacterium]|mgnify:FL=1|nr:glyoxalase [Gammaproteobacteria bacterium]|tara:strand:- start:9901 stop:10326 length:426 start_codon:yes stop_codon:yes gene_type:complete